MQIHSKQHKAVCLSMNLKPIKKLINIQSFNLSSTDHLFQLTEATPQNSQIYIDFISRAEMLAGNTLMVCSRYYFHQNILSGGKVKIPQEIKKSKEKNQRHTFKEQQWSIQYAIMKY